MGNEEERNSSSDVSRSRREINAHWIFIEVNETPIKPHFLRLSPGEHGMRVV